MRSQLEVDKIMQEFKSHEFFDEEMLKLSQDIQEKCLSLAPMFAEYSLPIDVPKLRADALKIKKP